MATASGQRNRRTALWLAGLVLGMFGFGFALVPLYNLFCQVTGIQSVQLRTASGSLVAESEPVDFSRSVTVKFDATVNPALPWEFQPPRESVRLHPGEQRTVIYTARNRSNDTITGQAIPSVVPWQANSYLKKIECFCFTSQTLAGGETVEMPVRFSLSPHLPEGINSLTLSYIFMRPEPAAADEARTARSDGHDHDDPNHAASDHAASDQKG